MGAFFGMTPGQRDISETQEKAVFWGRYEQRINQQIRVSSAAVDAANTPTTTLRAGLVMGRITSSGLYVACDPDGVDGSEVPRAVLGDDLSTLNALGTAEVKTPAACIRGPVKASALLVQGVALVGSTFEHAIRAQMARAGFVFDDEWTEPGNSLVVPAREINKAANYTVVAADNGTLFTASAAAVFTLPAVAPGLTFEFLNLADANVGVASASAGEIVWLHDVAANSLTFSTSSEKIGGRLRFRANAAGTKWYVENLSINTVTVAT